MGYKIKHKLDESLQNCGLTIITSWKIIRFKYISKLDFQYGRYRSELSDYLMKHILYKN